MPANVFLEEIKEGVPDAGNQYEQSQEQEVVKIWENAKEEEESLDVLEDQGQGEGGLGGGLEEDLGGGQGIEGENH